MKNLHAKILIVDDDKTACDMLRDVLEGEGYTVTTALSGEEAVEAGEHEKFDVVITDLKMKDMDGIDVLRSFQEKSPDASIILITAFGSMDSAVEAIQAGAYDYLSKPFKLDDIRLTVRRALERRVPKESKLRVQEAVEKFGEIIGQSPGMVEVYKIVARVANTHSTVLIQGESGTGKELIARAIHMKSTRRDKPFVAINCGAISETLLESELFGHEKGAFTGAVGLHKGIFEEAEGGTCLLDEIGEMPISMQAKLLRVLQDGEIRRVGSAHPLKIDVRIIAASNKNLEDLVEKGSFREDLLYRLNALTITLPPLRERREDIPLLVNYFLKKYSARLGKPLVEISTEAMGILMNYHWSGNVRELENVIERAVTLSPSSVIMPENLPKCLQSPESVLEEPPSFPPNLTLKEIEKICIMEVLERVGGNKSRAAAILGIDRKTLRAKIAEYKINSP